MSTDNDISSKYSWRLGAAECVLLVQVNVSKYILGAEWVPAITQQLHLLHVKEEDSLSSYSEQLRS